MRLRSVRCAVCASSWRGRRVRFCGHCGAHLAPPARRDDALTARLAARGAAAVAVLAAAGITAAALAWAWPGGDGPPASGRIELAALDAEMIQRTRTPDELEALRRQVDPERLQCEPEGCAQWRYDRAAVVDLDVSRSGSTVLLSDGLLRRHEPDGDGWSRPLADVFAAPTGELDSATLTATHVRADTGGVLVATRDVITALDTQGRTSWRVAAGGGEVQELTALEGTLLVERASRHEETSATPSTAGHDTADPTTRRTLSGYDRADGRLRWQREVVAVHDSTEAATLIATAEHDLVVLDPRTGRQRWAVTDNPGRTPRIFAEWVALSTVFGHQLHDADDGAVTDRLNGLIAGEAVELPDGGWATYVEISDHDRANWSPQRRVASARVTVIDPTGQVRWTRAFEEAAAPRCCTRLVVDRRGALEAMTAGKALRLSADSGRTLQVNYTSEPEVSWHDEHGRINRTAESLVVRDGSASVTATSPELAILSEAPWVVADDDAVMGISPVATP